MWMRDKTNDKICYSDGEFHTSTMDWNCDGDVYTDTVMTIHYLCNKDYCHIHQEDLVDYEMLTDEYVRFWLYQELDRYFIKDINERYYCDPTYSGKHFGDYGFLEGGHCVYENNEHREKAIIKEIEYIMDREKG